MLRLADIFTAWYILSKRSLENMFSNSALRKQQDARRTCTKLKELKLASGETPDHDGDHQHTDKPSDHPHATNPWVNKEKPEDPDAWMMAPLQELSNRSISRMSHHRLANYVQSLPPDKETESITESSSNHQTTAQ